MAKPNDLTSYALEGYRTHRNENMKSSPAWFACEVGMMFERSGRTEPKDVRMGRGYRVHASGLLFQFETDGHITRIR